MTNYRVLSLLYIKLKFSVSQLRDLILIDLTLVTSMQRKWKFNNCACVTFNNGELIKKTRRGGECWGK